MKSIIVPLFLILAACSHSSDSASPSSQAPTPVPASDKPLAPADGGQTGTIPSTPEETDCLAARSTQETAGAVCVTQGFYHFMSFRGASLENPQNLEIQMLSLKNELQRSLKNPKISTSGGKQNLEFDDQGQSMVEFRGLVLRPGQAPDFGYSIIGGNSGVCRAFRSGTPQKCLDIVKPQIQGYSDNFYLPEVATTVPRVTFLYNKVPVTHYGGDFAHYGTPAVGYAEAQSYCQNLQARLPSNREMAEELQRLSFEQLIKETQFPNAEISSDDGSPESIIDPGLKREATESKGRGYLVVAKANAAHHWSVDFYFQQRSTTSTFAQMIRKAQEINDEVDINDLFTGSPSIFKEHYFVLSNSGNFVDMWQSKANFICVKDN